MFRPRIFSTLLLAVALALTFGARSASADFFSTLDVTNLSGFSAPFGVVDVHLVDATHATVTFTASTVNGNIYLFGDGGSVAVNVNAATWTVSNITGSNAGTGFTNNPGDLTNGGPGNENGFGSFNQTINDFNGFTHAVDTLSFTLTNTSGTWASDSVVLTPNGSGNDAAAHIFVTTAPANAANGASFTGFAAETGAAIVPEPSTMAIAGLGALGFIGYGLRRRLKK